MSRVAFAAVAPILLCLAGCSRPPAGSYEAFEEFAIALASRNAGKLFSFVERVPEDEEEVAEEEADEESEERRKVPMTATGKVNEFRLKLDDYIREVFDVDHTLEESKPSEDRQSVALKVLQKLRIDPPGTHSTMGMTSGSIRYDVTMSKRGSSWKVTDFSAKILPQK